MIEGVAVGCLWLFYACYSICAADLEPSRNHKMWPLGGRNSHSAKAGTTRPARRRDISLTSVKPMVIYTVCSTVPD